MPLVYNLQMDGGNFEYPANYSSVVYRKDTQVNNRAHAQKPASDKQFSIS